MYRAWTVNEVATLRQLAKSGLTQAEAAVQMGRTPAMIGGACARYGIAWSRGAPAELTLHQKRIARLVAAGYSNEQISSELGVNAKHVKDQLTAIFNKTGCHNRTRLVLYALRTGLLTIEEAWGNENG